MRHGGRWRQENYVCLLNNRCDGNGLPMPFLLTVGERHEAVMFEP